MWTDTSPSPAVRSGRVLSLGMCKVSSIVGSLSTVDTPEELSCSQSGRTALLTLISAASINTRHSENLCEFRHFVLGSLL